jgi:type IV pilus assembly protein PilO
MALTLDDKPWWMGLLVGLVLAAAIVYGVQSLLVKDIRQDIDETDRKIAELDEKISQGQAAERKLPQFREEVKRLELELEKLRRILPSTRNTEEIIKKIKSLVDQGEFTLKKLSFPPLGRGTSDMYAEWPISIQVDGRYHDLAILFNRLGNFSRIINVEQIGIRALPNQQTRTIAATFTAKTFVYVESEEPSAEEKAAGTSGKGKKGKKKPGKKK